MDKLVATALSAGLLLAAGSAVVRADEAPTARPVMLPGTGYPLVLEDTSGGVGVRLPPRGMVLALETWIADRLHVPPLATVPRFAFATPHQLITMRYRAVPGDQSGGAKAPPDGEVVALYERESGAIYLPAGWSGRTPAELSVLAHELVHYIQDQAGLRYACPEEMEKAAFDTQAELLAMFGTDLEEEFGIDPFTQLVRTICLPY